MIRAKCCRLESYPCFLIRLTLFYFYYFYFKIKASDFIWAPAEGLGAR
jgi:hypothetical protein